MLAIKNINSSYLSEKETRFRALFALGIVSFFWGTTWVAAKEGVRYMPALQLSALRQFIGGAIYLIYFMLKGHPFPRRKEWWPILVLSFLNFMLSNALSTWGVKYISAGLGSIIGAIFPVWLVIIGMFSKKSKLPVKTLLGLLLGFTGICVIFYEHLLDFLNVDFRFGIFLSILATWTWAFGTLYTKAQANHFNPYFSLGLQMMISGIVLYLTSTALGMNIPIKMIPWQSWTAIAYLVIFGSVISFIAYLYALQHLPTSLVSVYAYFNPVVAVLIGAIIFHEKLTPFIAIGGLITIMGVYLVNETYRRDG